ncbi:MAG: TolC family protein [Chitinophagaceae bacterium]|nr:TolC family protein [Chitinophagaceae bacterium]
MKTFISIIILFITISGSAQKIMTIDEALTIAVKNNYDILLARTEAEATAIDYSYANMAFLPQLGGTASKVWNNNSQRSDFEDGRKREGEVNSSSLNAAVNLDWTLFDGLKMFATRERVKQLKLYGDLNTRTQVVNTIAEVTNRYYLIVRQKQQLKALDTLMTINVERVKIADKKISVGLGSKPELLQAKVDLNAQKAERLQQEKLVLQLKEQLNQLIGLPVASEYEVADSIPLNLNIQYDSIVRGIENVNPNLIASKKTIDIAQLALKERKGELFPTIRFNSAYNFGRVNNGNVVNPEFQPIFNLNKGLNYGFSATVPIFTQLNTRRLIKQAGLDIEYNKIAYNSQVSQVSLNVNNVYKDYQYQIRALHLEEENISLAKENVFIALERFRQGVSTYIELREAQISLEDALNRLIAARYNTKLAETELLRLKGALNSSGVSK